MTENPASRPRAIDIHAHYFPDAYLDLMAAEGARHGMGTRRAADGFYLTGPGKPVGPLPQKFIDLKLRLAEMDQQGVAVQALSLTAPMVYWANADLSHRLAKAFNDAASAAHRQYPDRFVGFMTLPMLDADRALDELNRAAKLPGIRGVYLGTNIDSLDLDNARFAPVLARIEALELPIFLHPLNTVPSERLAPWHLGNLIGNPLDNAIAAAHLIFGGVLDRHPRLQVNIPHAGGVLPILIGRFDRGHRMREETRHLQKPPSSYLRRFTYDTISHSPAILKFVISQVGADRVMVGSDYCFDMGYEQPVEVVDKLGLESRDRDMILGGTAARILKL